jgi:hypothetical protein
MIWFSNTQVLKIIMIVLVKGTFMPMKVVDVGRIDTILQKDMKNLGEFLPFVLMP